MGFFRQNIVSVAIFCAAGGVCVFSLVHVVRSAPERIRRAYHYPSQFMLPGQELERANSPDGAYVAVLGTCDGVGLSPAGSTVTLQAALPAGSPSSPAVVAFTPFETLPFQGISSLNWKGSHLLEIEHYSDIAASKTIWRSIRIQFKYLDAAAEMP